MSKLLSANFSRLRKSRVFWLCALATLLISVVMIYESAGTAAALLERGAVRHLDDFYFELAPYTGAIMAIFISLFLGTEYSDGTVRNKLVVGHTRTNIYLANLLTCLSGGLIVTALWLIGGLPGLYLIGHFEMGLSGVLTYFLVATGVTAAFTAIFVWVSTLSRNKAVTVVLVIVLWMAMSLAGSGIYDRLHEVEFNGGMAYINGEFVMVDETPNPLYLTGSARTVAELLYRVLPTGQAIAMTCTEISTPWLDIAISLIVSAVITAAGVLSFRKKDLK